MPHFVFTLLLSVLPSVTGLSCNVYTRSTSDPKAVSSVETCGADLTSCVTFQVHRRSHAACSAAVLPKRSHRTLHTHTLPVLRCSLQYLSAGVTTIKGLCATGPGSTPPIANPCQAQKNTTEMTLAAGVIMNSWSCMACADANPCNKIDPIPAPASANAASRASSLATTALITAAGAATALTL